MSADAEFEPPPELFTKSIRRVPAVNVDAMEREIAALTEKLRTVEAERDEAIVKYTGQIEAAEQSCKREIARHEQTRTQLSALRAELQRKEAALRRIAEGNLGDKPWQGDYGAIRAIAVSALKPKEPPCQTA